jgi:hypothetical protein
LAFSNGSAAGLYGGLAAPSGSINAADVEREQRRAEIMASMTF